jgi:hypothetical protein
MLASENDLINGLLKIDSHRLPCLHYMYLVPQRSRYTNYAGNYIPAVLCGALVAPHR